ncbi:MAG: Nif3-like dinuclear metal center hexameric protein [Anaerolineales bacterium]|nr:Nif3-like dinuclear metal center hexameric protein [Anaerolineales bacterium]MCB0017260.1 Nif3-like dinuclear metal center hexameric protein [Anaerolineales bacterium]MCB0028167.1 Nif3-like dinuclear metal center hexameric protein [Anaerolineales bacterium]MCB8961050.1 Nif3-like dinuclear metal center hexameric protein [Ardenticatenales bacterium]
MKTTALISHLDEFLRINEYADYGPQGLQVEAARDEIKRVALAVDSAPAVIAAAAEWGADMLLVHHGLFWGPTQNISGPLGQRVRGLLGADMHLYAAHLALDGHDLVGNNAVLAQMFDILVESWWCTPKNQPIGVLGMAPAGTTLADLTATVGEKLGAQPRVLAHGPAQVSQVAIVSGFGANNIAEAAALGADTFLTGETSHAQFWDASDYGLNLIYAGHYATETVGVQALGQHLQEKFTLETRFFDFPTGM